MSIKQYLKDKPIKWGLKTFLLCESETGYIVNAEIYTGKKDNDPTFVPELGINGSLVVRLSTPYLGQNYCLFTDRFYTSVLLAEYLLANNGTRLVGTALTTRKRFPGQLVSKKMDRGTSQILFNGTVAAASWCDKRPTGIYFVMSKYVNTADDTVLRYSATEHKRVPVSCPAVAKQYNAYMGGTDRNDQLTKLHRSRRHYKCPRRLMIKFFMWTAYNAYILQNYKIPHKQPGKRLVTFHMFLDQLCHELIGAFRRCSTPTLRRRSKPNEACLINVGNVPQHLVEKPPHATTNNRCVVCTEKYRRAKQMNPGAHDVDLPKRSKTVYWCSSCEVFLCVASGTDNCFKQYHTLVQYWS